MPHGNTVPQVITATKYCLICAVHLDAEWRLMCFAHSAYARSVMSYWVADLTLSSAERFELFNELSRER